MKHLPESTLLYRISVYTSLPDRKINICLYKDHVKGFLRRMNNGDMISSPGVIRNLSDILLYSIS